MTDLPPVVQVKAARAELAKRILVVLVALTVAAVLGTMLWVVVTIRHQQVVNISTNTTSSQELAILIDCTTPQGKCFRAAQASTTGAVDSLAEQQLAAVFCVAQPGNTSIARVLACLPPTMAVLAKLEGH